MSWEYVKVLNTFSIAAVEDGLTLRGHTLGQVVENDYGLVRVVHWHGWYNTSYLS